jgi:uncharacterized protein YndB with AHSA1/START domain
VLRKILVTVVVLVVAAVAFVTSRPSTYRVERSATVAAPPEAVFARIADFHAWEAWSPWARLDPAMTTRYEGSGVGATYAWKGNKDVGEGRMTLLEADPARRVAIRLEFIEPFPSTSSTEFLLAPAAGDGTSVTWVMTGRLGFVEKAFTLFADMDQMIGKDFEKGLAALKRLAEAAP